MTAPREGVVRLEYHEGPFGMFPSYVQTLDEPTHLAFPAPRAAAMLRVCEAARRLAPRLTWHSESGVLDEFKLAVEALDAAGEG